MNYIAVIFCLMPSKDDEKHVRTLTINYQANHTTEHVSGLKSDQKKPESEK